MVRLLLLCKEREEDRKKREKKVTIREKKRVSSFSWWKNFKKGNPIEKERGSEADHRCAVQRRRSCGKGGPIMFKRASENAKMPDGEIRCPLKKGHGGDRLIEQRAKKKGCRKRGIEHFFDKKELPRRKGARISRWG